MKIGRYTKNLMLYLFLLCALLSGCSPKLGYGLVFNSNLNGENEIYRITNNNHQIQRLTYSIGNDPTKKETLDVEIPYSADKITSITKDGSSVLFEGLYQGHNFIFRLDRDGKMTLISKLSPPQGSYAAEWSPDGKQIAFVSLITRNVGQLELTDADGFNQHSINPEQNVWISSVRWSPDGQNLAYFSGEGHTDVSGILITNLATNETRQVKDQRIANCNDMNWSPTGDQLVARCSLPDGSRASIFVISLKTLEGLDIIGGDKGFHYCYSSVWSPSGDMIATFCGKEINGVVKLFTVR